MIQKLKQQKSLLHWFLLIVAGAGWGWSISLTKIAAQSGYHPMTLMFWQMVIATVILITWMVVNRIHLPLTRQHIVFYFIAGILGTALPNSLAYYIAPHLPAGIISIVFSLVPMMAFTLAVLFKAEKFNALRFLGVVLGLLSVLLLIAPGFDFNAALSPLWIFLLLISAFCYASESIFATFFMPAKDHPLTILTGMTIASLIMIMPIMLIARIPFPIQNFLGTPEKALIGSTLLHIGCYATYLYLIRHTGVIFASQISYIVTISGVIWGIIIFTESHSLWIWASLVIAIAGLGLVRQRKETPLELKQQESNRS